MNKISIEFLGKNNLGTFPPDRGTLDQAERS